MPEIIRISSSDLFNRFELGELLGSGGYGVVHVATDYDNEGKQVALKFMQSRGDGSDSVDIARELVVAQSVDSPYVSKLYEIFQVEPSKQTFHCDFVISMEYIAGPALGRFVWENPGKHILHIAHDLVSGLADMHSTFVHRDIKAYNVVLDMPDGKTLRRAVFVDFGLSCLKSACDPGAYGTIVSPDHARFRQGRQANYDLLGDDIYSTGVTIMHAITGTMDRSCLYNSHQCGRGDVLVSLAKNVVLPTDLAVQEQETLRKLLVGMLKPTDYYRITTKEALQLVKGWGKRKVPFPVQPEQQSRIDNSAGPSNATSSPPSTIDSKLSRPSIINAKSSRPTIIEAAGDCLTKSVKRKNRVEMVAEMKRTCPDRLSGSVRNLPSEKPVASPPKPPMGVGKKPVQRAGHLHVRSPRAAILAAGEGCLLAKEKRQNRVKLIAILQDRCPDKLT